MTREQKAAALLRAMAAKLPFHTVSHIVEHPEELDILIADLERPATPPVVIVTRHPDYDNEFTTYGDVEIVDVDLGRSDLSNPDEYAMWHESHMRTVAQLRDRGLTESADALEAIINEAEETSG